MSIRVSNRWDQRLHAASVKGDVEEIRRVLDTGRVHIDCMDRDGTTPLILAAANGHIECVKELLEQGADPTATRNTGTSALFFASQGGFIDILKILIDAGTPVNKSSKDGGTPLIVASQCGHLDVVLELLSRGADPHMAMRDRATAIFVAAQNGHGAVVKALLQAGARTNVRRVDGSSPVWISAQMGHAYIVKLLLAFGADVDSCRHDGATPLFKAAHKGHVDVIRELLQHRPKIGILKNGESPLHAACLYGHSAVARLLLKGGADPTLRNDEGLTPLQIAVQANHSETANLLRDAVSQRRDLSPTSGAPRIIPKKNGSATSSRYSSLETIVESSPILPRKSEDNFTSCELSAISDAKPKASLAVGSTDVLHRSSSPLVTNGYKNRQVSQSHGDLRSVKNFFQWTLSSFRRSSRKSLNLEQ